MAELLLGIDVGTSAVKAGLFDAEGPLFGLGRTAHAVSAPRPTWAECDPELWWRGILKSLAEACRQADVGPQDVAAVGMGVLFPVVVPLDRNARALHPAILYSDQRSLNQVRAIEDAIGRKRYEGMIGNNLVPGTCAVTSMAWLRDEKPEAYSKAATLASGNTFVAARLTGEFCADPSMVGLSGLVDISDPWRWSADLCEQVGIDADRLPRIAGAAEVIGGVSQAAARETGLRPGTPGTSSSLRSAQARYRRIRSSTSPARPTPWQCPCGNRRPAGAGPAPATCPGTRGSALGPTLPAACRSSGLPGRSWTAPGTPGCVR